MPMKRAHEAKTASGAVVRTGGGAMFAAALAVTSAGLPRQDLPLAPDDYAGFTMSLLRMIAFVPDELEAAPNSAGKPSRPAQAPAAPRAAQRTTQPAAFDGDWPALVAEIAQEPDAESCTT